MELFDTLSNHWKNRQKDLDKNDVSYIAYKDTFRHAMRGFLTGSYYKRNRLIKEGDLVYGYVFKTWSNDPTNQSDYPTWVLFSPSLEVSKNPAVFARISAKLQDLTKEDDDKKYRKLRNLIIEPLSECDYFEIPEEFTEGAVVYLSIIYLHVNQITNFHMGLNPLLMSRGISKEVIYLPDRFWPGEFYEAYLKNEVK